MLLQRQGLIAGDPMSPARDIIFPLQSESMVLISQKQNISMATSRTQIEHLCSLRVVIYERDLHINQIRYTLCVTLRLSTKLMTYHDDF